MLTMPAFAWMYWRKPQTYSVRIYNQLIRDFEPGIYRIQSRCAQVLDHNLTYVGIQHLYESQHSLTINSAQRLSVQENWIWDRYDAPKHRYSSTKQIMRNIPEEWNYQILTSVSITDINYKSTFLVRVYLCHLYSSDPTMHPPITHDGWR